MTPSELAQGNNLNTLINYYTTVMADLAAGNPTTTAAFINFISLGNTNIPASENTAWLNAIRADMITAFLEDLSDRKTALEAQFAAL